MGTTFVWESCQLREKGRDIGRRTTNGDAEVPAVRVALAVSDHQGASANDDHLLDTVVCSVCHALLTTTTAGRRECPAGLQTTDERTGCK